MYYLYDYKCINVGLPKIGVPPVLIHFIDGFSISRPAIGMLGKTINQP